MSPPSNTPPLQKYSFPPILSSLTLPPSTFLSSHNHIKHLMTATIVFQTPPSSQLEDQQEEDKMLLLRRAPTDSYPLKWELPGGMIDIPTDPSILSAAARELWEETSLVATHFHAHTVGLLHPEETVPEPEVSDWGVDPSEESAQEEDDSGVKVVTFLETGETWGKITLIAEVEDASLVRADPDEHAEWAWVTEREVRTGWLEGGDERRVLGLVSLGVRSIILEGFRLRRKIREEVKTE